MPLLNKVLGKPINEAIDILCAAYEEKQASMTKQALSDEARNTLIGGLLGAGVGGVGMMGRNLIKGKKLRARDALYGALMGSVPGAVMGNVFGPAIRESLKNRAEIASGSVPSFVDNEKVPSSFGAASAPPSASSLLTPIDDEVRAVGAAPAKSPAINLQPAAVTSPAAAAPTSQSQIKYNFGPTTAPKIDPPATAVTPTTAPTIAPTIAPPAPHILTPKEIAVNITGMPEGTEKINALIKAREADPRVQDEYLELKREAERIKRTIESARQWEKSPFHPNNLPGAQTTRNIKDVITATGDGPVAGNAAMRKLFGVKEAPKEVTPPSTGLPPGFEPAAPDSITPFSKILDDFNRRNATPTMTNEELLRAFQAFQNK